jgi:hypothetical protein
MTTTARHRWGMVASALALALAASPAVQAEPAAATSCAATWGSVAKRNAVTHTTGTVGTVRAGRHACFDRLVVTVGKVPRTLSYDVRYVESVRRPGSGTAVPLAGGADLRIVLRAPAYTSTGAATYRPADRARVVDVTGWSTFRQVALAGSYEGQTTFGLGVRARLPFRVMVLDGPGEGARLVVDVAHRW